MEISLTVRRLTRTLVNIPLLFAWMFLGFGQNVSARAATEVSANPPIIVIGFVGGFVRHDNAVHREVRLAAQLRKDYPAGAYVEVFENHRAHNARQQILLLLHLNHDGYLLA